MRAHYRNSGAERQSERAKLKKKSRETNLIGYHPSNILNASLTNSEKDYLETTTFPNTKDKLKILLGAHTKNSHCMFKFRMYIVGKTSPFLKFQKIRTKLYNSNKRQEIFFRSLQSAHKKQTKKYVFYMSWNTSTSISLARTPSCPAFTPSLNIHPITCFQISPQECNEFLLCNTTSKYLLIVFPTSYCA